ncbi:MAG: M20/M25/M40 family metallo-hydrolase, partial [Bryobacteraceae bacterium]
PTSIFNGTGNTRYATSRVKVLNAQKHGAVAVLLVAEPNRKHPSNQERIARIAGTAGRVARLPSQAIEGDEVGIPLFTVSDRVAADLLSAAGKQAAAVQTAIDRDLHPASIAIPDSQGELHVVNRERRRATTANVVGLLEGSDPALRNETIVFSGHYDHDGPAANGQVFHGADDNGSGTVGVVELARAYSRNAARPKRTLLFAVFAAEERGLLGSYYYVQHPLRPLDLTRAVINFDMIGRNEADSAQTKGLIQISADTSNELNLVGMKYSPDYRAAVERADRTVGLHLNYKWDDEAALNVYFRSDQFPFALHDIPAMWWFTGFHPDYHQVTDTVEKINFPKMEKIVRLAYLTGWMFTDEAAPPRFIANPAGAALSSDRARP